MQEVQHLFEVRGYEVGDDGWMSATKLRKSFDVSLATL